MGNCSICGKEIKLFEEGTPVCAMCEQATAEERESRSTRMRPTVKLPKATGIDQWRGKPEK
jgi:hypothetical protein